LDLMRHQTVRQKKFLCAEKNFLRVVALVELSALPGCGHLKNKYPNTVCFYRFIMPAPACHLDVYQKADKLRQLC